MTATPDLGDASIAAVDLPDPGALVGRKVRRRTSTAPRYTTWAQIVMTVPSRDGLCWLVTFIDGDVDVWRVEDPTVHYQFHTHSAHEGRRT